VDGQFQQAGYDDDRLLEVHGSIHWLQCTTPCNHNISKNNEVFTIDERSMRSRQIPKCPGCEEVSRPNILMFGDWAWLPDRTRVQEHLFERFVEDHADKKIAVIEMGAGSAIPTIRATSERIGLNLENATVIRINPREPDIKAPHISMPCGALEGLKKIDALL
jgi:NAD-dependent SIR2 family protein deacetylase